jgi:hypothetical protein
MSQKQTAQVRGKQVWRRRKTVRGWQAGMEKFMGKKKKQVAQFPAYAYVLSRNFCMHEFSYLKLGLVLELRGLLSGLNGLIHRRNRVLVYCRNHVRNHYCSFLLYPPRYYIFIALFL